MWKQKNWIIFAIIGVALLTVGIVISTIVGQERIGFTPDYRRTRPFDIPGLVLAAIGGFMILVSIIGNIGPDEDLTTAT